jgi:hypothetical protein
MSTLPPSLIISTQQGTEHVQDTRRAEMNYTGADGFGFGAVCTEIDPAVLMGKLQALGEPPGSLC